MGKSLEHLKAGDKIMVLDFYKLTGHIRTIDRVTNTQLVSGNYKIRRKDGYQIGSGGDVWKPSIYWREYDVCEVEKLNNEIKLKKVKTATSLLKDRNLYTEEILVELLNNLKEG